MQSNCCYNELIGNDSRTQWWPGSVLSLAITVWKASPLSYRILSKLMYVPSDSLLRLYKNTTDKDSGVNDSLITWMHKECERTGTEKEGGLIFDKMHQQPWVQLDPSGDGLKCLDSSILHHTTMVSLCIKRARVWILLQPFSSLCFWPVTASVFPLFIFWLMAYPRIIMNRLKSGGFLIMYVCIDCAAINRSFLSRICGLTTSVSRNSVF